MLFSLFIHLFQNLSKYGKGLIKRRCWFLNPQGLVCNYLRSWKNNIIMFFRSFLIKTQGFGTVIDPVSPGVPSCCKDLISKKWQKLGYLLVSVALGLKIWESRLKFSTFTHTLSIPGGRDGSYYLYMVMDSRIQGFKRYLWYFTKLQETYGERNGDTKGYLLTG